MRTNLNIQKIKTPEGFHCIRVGRTKVEKQSICNFDIWANCCLRPNRFVILTALVAFVLVRVVETIVVAVAYVDPRYAVAIVAGEEVAEAGASLGLAVAGRFVAAVETVVVAVAVPGRRYASVVRAPEAVLRAGSLGAVKGILVAVVAAVVVTVAEPVRFDAYVRRLALKMVRRTGGVLRASLVGLVGGDVVLTVVHTIADLNLRYATVIGAGEFAGGAGRIDAALLVASVTTVVLVIALPRLEDAASVSASELVGTARVVGAVVGVLVGAVTAVVVTVARPHPRYASAVSASESAGVAGDVLRHAHPVLVDEPTGVVALALGDGFRSGMARLVATAVAYVAGVHLAELPVSGEDMEVARRVLQTFDQLDLVGTGVLLGAIDTA